MGKFQNEKRYFKIKERDAFNYYFLKQIIEKESAEKWYSLLIFDSAKSERKIHFILFEAFRKMNK